MTYKARRSAIIAALVLSLIAPSAYAGRGGRGGGGGGMRGGGGGGFGGGGMRAGGGGGFGGGGGGGMRPGGGSGGFSHSPGINPPRAPQRPSVGGGGGGRPSTLPSGPGSPNRGGLGQAGLGNRPGIDSRPGAGQPGVGNRPGTDNRPGVGQIGLGNRPGIDSRPGINQPGLANRPGIDSRPGINQPGLANRAGVENRTNIGNQINAGNNIASNRQINNVSGNTFNRVDPGYGVRPPAYNNWRGGYDGYHSGWVNGYWHGYHNGTSWNWGSFAVGAATGVAGWGLGSALYGWGYAPYANPYYAMQPAAEPVVIQQSVAGGAPETVTVPAAAYDYSQPLNAQSAPPAADVADPAVAKFDSARDAFKTGDYAKALQLADEALKSLPNDATLHEFRALVFFAIAKYDLAAGPLYAVLAVGPGWDWTTMVGLYPDVDVYTKQLRALEQYTRDKPKESAGHFVLGYQYLTQGNIDASVAQLKQVAALNPGDTLSAQLVKQFSKTAESPEPAPSPAPAPATPAVKEGTLAGSWTAKPRSDITINLKVQDDGSFKWDVSSKGKPQEIAGNWSYTSGVLTLVQGAEGGPLVGNVAWQAPNRFAFHAIGTGADDPGLTFTR